MARTGTNETISMLSARPRLRSTWARLLPSISAKCLMTATRTRTWRRLPPKYSQAAAERQTKRAR
jgi:hypothetical protein